MFCFHQFVQVDDPFRMIIHQRVYLASTRVSSISACPGARPAPRIYKIYVQPTYLLQPISRPLGPNGADQAGSPRLIWPNRSISQAPFQQTYGNIHLAPNSRCKASLVEPMLLRAGKGSENKTNKSGSVYWPRANSDYRIISLPSTGGFQMSPILGGLRTFLTQEQSSHKSQIRSSLTTSN